MSGKGYLAISQDHPSPFGQEGGLQVSGFSSGTAPGIAYCGGKIRWAGLILHGPTQSSVTACPQLGWMICRPHCCFWGYLMPFPIQLDDVLPLLRSFGHAKTVLNANASRFGQVLCLCLQQ